MPNIFPPIQLQQPSVGSTVEPDQASILGTVGAPSGAAVSLNGADNALQSAQAKVQADTPQKYDYSAHGVLGNIGHVLGRVGNVAADILDPRVAPLIPGTNEYKQAHLEHDQGQAQLAATNQESAQRESDTVANEEANRTQKGDIDEAKQETANAKVDATLRQHGFKMDPNKGPVPLTYEEMSPSQQAVHDLNESKSAQADATAELKQAQATNDPAKIALAQAKLASVSRSQDIALQRIGLSREALGFQEDKQYNPQPTAQERNKGDLGQSSIHQIGEMQDVLAKRPEIFGPGAGRANRIQQWLGSSDPDAIRYRSSSQYLADHSAALFGARGEYIMKQLHDLTDERFGPEALKQALTEAQNTSQGFVNAGTTHSKGGHSSYSTPAGSGGTQSFNVNGKVYNIPADKVADFKKDFPNAK